jgi:hypothetical protein
VTFMVEKLALRQDILKVLRVSPVSIVPPMVTDHDLISPMPFSLIER